MKKFTLLAAAGVFAALATTASAGEIIKPLASTTIVAKSTQAPPISLGLGGLGAGASTALIIGGIITTVVIINATSGT